MQIVRILAGLPTVTAHIGAGKEKRTIIAILDTGSSATIISERLAGDLGLKPALGPKWTTFAGSAPILVARVGPISIECTDNETAALPEIEVGIASYLADFTKRLGIRADALIGFSFLRHFRMTLDYSEFSLRLEKVEPRMRLTIPLRETVQTKGAL